MSVLRDICRAKKARVKTLRREWTTANLEGGAHYARPRLSLARALRREEPSVDEIRFLTEIKRASPSAGWICQNADAVAVARRYAEAGSSAISLLTEEEYFRGRLDDLPLVRAIGLPVLMKDFFVDPYQVILARGMGADAILLIAAIDDVPLLREVRDAATELGIEVLLEVHSESECDLVHYLEPELAGVNNRNLATFEVSLETSETLLPRLPETATRLSESGIRTRPDVERLAAAGFDGLLVGEALMRAEDPGSELELLRGGRRPRSESES